MPHPSSGICLHVHANGKPTLSDDTTSQDGGTRVVVFVDWKPSEMSMKETYEFR